MKREQVCCGYPMEHRRRYYPDSGVTQGRAQCAFCGSCFGDAVKVVPDMPIFDDDAFAQWREGRSIFYAERAAQRMAEFYEKQTKRLSTLEGMDYSEYLQTDHWRKMRTLALLRDDWECQVCKAPATEVHHITYNHRGHEYLWELVSLCRSCHQDQHPEKKPQ